MMVLLAYFQHAGSVLPKLDGPLSITVPVSTITAANKEEKQVLPCIQHGRVHDRFSPEVKVLIVR